MRIVSDPENKKVFRQIKRISRSFLSGITNANKIIGKDISEKSVNFVKNGPKTGEVGIQKDPVTGVFRLHQASAPGESPANFSGSLAASIGYKADSNQLRIGAGGSEVPIVTAVGAGGQLAFADTVDYASELELQMRRPYLIKAIKEEQKNTERNYVTEISRRLLKI